MVSTRASSRAMSVDPDASFSIPATPSRRNSRPAEKTPKYSSSSSSSSSSTSAAALFVHAPTSITLFWMAVSLPLVIWDTIYILGRPHTMEGGWLHYPLWAPYKLYGQVDHVYGWKAFHARSGFPSAQGFLNAVETAMYLWYVYVWWASKHTTTTITTNKVALAAANKKTATVKTKRKVLAGKAGAVALMMGFSAAVMTLSKTALYWLNEYFSGFDNIGHNALADLFVLWIIPNGAWLVFPLYMIISLGSSIIDGLAGRPKRE